MANAKKKLIVESMKMTHQRQFLEGAYKILLLKTESIKEEELRAVDCQTPTFMEMIQKLMDSNELEKPVYSVTSKNSRTNIYMDKATKLEIIISTVKHNIRMIEERQGSLEADINEENESNELIR
jgi:hypothetical protein